MSIETIDDRDVVTRFSDLMVDNKPCSFTPAEVGGLIAANGAVCTKVFREFFEATKDPNSSLELIEELGEQMIAAQKVMTDVYVLVVAITIKGRGGDS